MIDTEGRKDMDEKTTTKRADYILSHLDTGEVTVISFPHDGTDGGRQVFRELGAAKHWLKRQCEIDAGRKFGSQGLMKA